MKQHFSLYRFKPLFPFLCFHHLGDNVGEAKALCFWTVHLPCSSARLFVEIDHITTMSHEQLTVNIQ